MYDFSLRRRVTMFFGMIFLFLPLIFGGGWLSYSTLMKYLSFPSEMTFSSFFIYGFSAVFILSPVAFFSLWPIFLKRNVSVEVQSKLAKYMVCVFVISVGLQLGVKVLFTNKLEAKGYVACPRTPDNWSPGMSTKYVLSPKKCNAVQTR